MDLKTTARSENSNVTYLSHCGVGLPEIKDDEICPVYPFPAKELKNPCTEIDVTKSDVNTTPNTTVTLMINTMYKLNGIGLAATQVGVPYRLIVWDVNWQESEKVPKVMYNPEIINQDNLVDSYEGCLSVPFDYKETIKRYNNIEVSGYNAKLEPITYKLQGLEARCVQHEIDHLNGKLFIDRLSRLKRDAYTRKVYKFIKKYKRGLQSGEDIVDEILSSNSED